MLNNDSEGDTVFDAVSFDEDREECFREFGEKNLTGDTAVVGLELEQRRYEQAQLLPKMRALLVETGLLASCT